MDWELIFWGVGGILSVLFLLFISMCGPRIGPELPGLDNEFKEYHDDMEDLR